jgi:hypothetical protein
LPISSGSSILIADNGFLGRYLIPCKAEFMSIGHDSIVGFGVVVYDTEGVGLGLGVAGEDVSTELFGEPEKQLISINSTQTNKAPIQG